MKRYCIVIADRGDGIHEPSGYEVPNGQFVSYEDLSAHMLKVKEVVEGMEHGHACDARYCQVCGRTDYAGCGTITKHERRTGKCTCGKSEALRLLGEVLG